MISGWIIATVVACLVAFVVVIDVAYRIYASRQIRNLIENVPPFGVIEDRRDVASEPVTITVKGLENKGQLTGCLYLPEGPVKAVVVFCHELNGNRWTAMSYIEALMAANIAVLSFDFHNHGDSCSLSDYTPIHWITAVEATDLQAAIDWVKSDERFQHLKLGLFGVSRGGCTALTVASMRSDIAAIATDSAYSTRSLIWSFTGRFSQHVCPTWFFSRLPDWHVWQDINSAIRRSERKTGRRYLHLEDVVQNLRSAVLMIGGSRDSYVTELVRNQLTQMLPAETECWLVPRAKHNRARTVATEEYDSKIVAHFQKHLISEDH
ncbi:MAG: alpha/beta fold hydrolase [Fuerstiella sp.]